MSREVYIVLWEQREVESGESSGSQPAGCSVHLSLTSADVFARAYWDDLKEKARQKDPTCSQPDEPWLCFQSYACPVNGSGYWAEVSDELYQDIVAAKGESGIRYQTLPPGLLEQR